MKELASSYIHNSSGSIQVNSALFFKYKTKNLFWSFLLQKN